MEFLLNCLMNRVKINEDIINGEMLKISWGAFNRKNNKVKINLYADSA